MSQIRIIHLGDLEDGEGGGNSTLTGSLSDGVDLGDSAVGVQPTGATPWEVQDWDYANSTAMLADSQIFDSSSGHPHELNIITGIGDMPGGGTRAFEARWRGDLGTGIDHTVGITYTWANAASDQPREIWVEIPIWFTSNWTSSGPLLGDPSAPDPGHKLIFMFDDQELGTYRWEIFNGLFTSHYMQLDFGGAKGTDAISGDFEGDTSANLWNAEWHVLRMHADMDADLWECMIDNEYYSLGSTVNTDPGAGHYFNKIALGRNINSGAGSNMALRWGTMTAYIVDPGWTFG